MIDIIHSFIHKSSQILLQFEVKEDFSSGYQIHVWYFATGIFSGCLNKFLSFVVISSRGCFLEILRIIYTKSKSLNADVFVLWLLHPTQHPVQLLTSNSLTTSAEHLQSLDTQSKTDEVCFFSSSAICFQLVLPSVICLKCLIERKQLLWVFTCNLFIQNWKSLFKFIWMFHDVIDSYYLCDRVWIRIIL